MFAEFLSNRIREYNAFGVWMHAHKDLGDDTHHICNILAVVTLSISMSVLAPVAEDEDS